MPKTTLKPINPIISLHDRYYDMNDANKKDFRKKMVSNCGKSAPTIWRWIEGKSLPNILFQEKIAEFFKVNHTEIWPAQSY